ncbi:hypothetical protein [Blautia phage Montmirail]|nr:hypothetical protein [Blautia phage Montmirail]
MLFDVSSKEHQIKKADRTHLPAFKLYCIISLTWIKINNNQYNWYY